jgi:ferrous iron transport protein A
MTPPRRTDLPSIEQKETPSEAPTRKKPCTLLDMRAGETAVISAVTGGKGLKARMAGLGIREGRRFRLIRTAPFRGPLLVEDISTGARIMIGRGMAACVEVCDQTSS